MDPYTVEPLVVAAPLFPRRLDAYLENTEHSLRALSEQSGVDKGTISEWRNGDGHAVRVPLVRKLATALGTTAEYLLDMPALGALDTHATAQVRLMPDLDRAEALVNELAGLITDARRGE